MGPKGYTVQRQNKIRGEEEPKDPRAGESDKHVQLDYILRTRYIIMHLPDPTKSDSHGGPRTQYHITNASLFPPGTSEEVLSIKPAAFGAHQ